MTDADAACYQSRYLDITADLDPKDHYMKIGRVQGRLPTCAPRLSKYEALRYISDSPELQRKFGQSGPAAITLAKSHY